MLIKVSNDIKIYNPSEEVINYCKSNLEMNNPDFIVAQKLGRHVGNMPRIMKLYVKNGECLILPFGCVKDILEIVPYDKSIYTLDFHPFTTSSLVGSINLYDYQQNALESLKKGKNGILEAPCGSGKTQIGLALIKEIDGKALWLTHTKKLLTQSKDRAKMYFSGDFGEITDGEVNIGKDITFATVQTMSKINPDIYKDAFDIVIVDECHHCVGTPTKAMQFYKILTNINCRYKYGLSATLSRSDNMINTLYSIIGKILYTIPKSAVGNKIIKAIHQPIMINLNYDDSEYISWDGMIDYTKLITMLSVNERRNKIICDKVLEEYVKGRKQLILCHRVKQVEMLSKEISKFCKVNSITGSVKNKSREYDGDVIIATYSLAKEGLDIPTLNVLHLATPQKNASTTEQSVGRIERNIDGKETPICYDYVDVTISYCMNCFKKRKSILKKNK